MARAPRPQLERTRCHLDVLLSVHVAAGYGLWTYLKPGFRPRFTDEGHRASWQEVYHELGVAEERAK